jgi:hypothetical protein
MYEVEIKSTDVGFDLDGAVVTPVVLTISDAVPMGTRIATIITVRLKLRIVQRVNGWDVTKVGSVLCAQQVCHQPHSL